MNKQWQEKPPHFATPPAGGQRPEPSEEERIEDKIDRDLNDSFPASDPPGWTLGVKKRRPKSDTAK